VAGEHNFGTKFIWRCCLSTMTMVDQNAWAERTSKVQLSRGGEKVYQFGVVIDAKATA
jgi:hypothetical protein